MCLLSKGGTRVVASTRGVGIRFATDNASGSSQEIHGRGAEINVLLHLHTYVSRMREIVYVCLRVKER